MIDADELARRLCAEGHLAPRYPGPIAVCATHILLARATYPLILPHEQPQGGRALKVLQDALEEANPPREAPPVAEGQVGLDELVPVGAAAEAPAEAYEDTRGPGDVG